MDSVKLEERLEVKLPNIPYQNSFETFYVNFSFPFILC